MPVRWRRSGEVGRATQCTPCRRDAYAVHKPGKVSPRSSCTRVVSNVKRYLGGASGVKNVRGRSVAHTLNVEQAGPSVVALRWVAETSQPLATCCAHLAPTATATNGG